MGVYIKGMEMPTACFACKLLSEPYWECRVHGYTNHSTECRPTDCPLIEVPEPHGRLGDLDALDVIGYRGIPQGCEDTFDDGVMWLAERIDELPTIIPASKESKV